MLAQNFKAAADLGISNVEHQALIKVLGMLERGEITDAHFIMSLVKGDCGTVGCICGWANIVSKGAAFPEIALGYGMGELCRRLSHETIELFAVFDGSEHRVGPGLIWKNARTPHAALALRSYLTTGDARWDLALAEGDGI